MQEARESQAALRVVTGAAVADAVSFMESTRGRFEARREALLEVVPPLVSYYADGSAALAADLYEYERAAAGVTGRYAAELVLVDRTVRIRRGIAWAAEPLEDAALVGGAATAASRLADVVQLNTARPYRDTLTVNTRKDPAATGWRRVVAADACRFCQMLGAKGAVFREDTVRFAAHDNCHCGAQPVFTSPGQAAEYGEVEASSLQYQANGGRLRTPEQKARLRDYLNTYFPDARG